MFKMAFRVVCRIKGRCSRHPAYNPVKDEQGGIKGGCEECHALFHGGMPAKGIVIAHLFSLVFWTCLGAALWRCGGVR
jgi:hypothetical protein